jgi:hypothetical protein
MARRVKNESALFVNFVGLTGRFCAQLMGAESPDARFENHWNRHKIPDATLVTQYTVRSTNVQVMKP